MPFAKKKTIRFSCIQIAENFLLACGARPATNALLRVSVGMHVRYAAGKTAMHVFTSSRDATQREKDLMRCVKDNELTVNFPGRVKVMGGAIGKRK